MSQCQKKVSGKQQAGLSLQQGVLHSGCLLKHQYSSAAPLDGLDTSEVSLAVLLAVNVGQVQSTKNVQGGVAPR